MTTNAKTAEAVKFLSDLGRSLEGAAEMVNEVGWEEAPWEEALAAGLAKFGAAHLDTMQSIEKHLKRIAQGIDYQ